MSIRPGRTDPPSCFPGNRCLLQAPARCSSSGRRCRRAAATGEGARDESTRSKRPGRTDSSDGRSFWRRSERRIDKERTTRKIRSVRRSQLPTKERETNRQGTSDLEDPIRPAGRSCWRRSERRIDKEQTTWKNRFVELLHNRGRDEAAGRKGGGIECYEADQLNFVLRGQQMIG